MWSPIGFLEVLSVFLLLQTTDGRLLLHEERGQGLTHNGDRALTIL